LFDCYAERFEEQLVGSLGYRTPEALVDALREALQDLEVGDRGRAILRMQGADAEGCAGRGLAGEGDLQDSHAEGGTDGMTSALNDSLARDNSGSQSGVDGSELPKGRPADGPKGGWGCCVDLGCGTGLLGPLLRPQAHSLDGVDLSGKMMEKARGKECYDRLFVRDVVKFLEEQHACGVRYDVLVAVQLPVQPMEAACLRFRLRRPWIRREWAKMGTRSP
jgi:predicted TPR repeat methyltransferase